MEFFLWRLRIDWKEVELFNGDWLQSIESSLMESIWNKETCRETLFDEVSEYGDWLVGRFYLLRAFLFGN